MSDLFSQVTLVAILQSTLRMATPLILAATGGLYSDKMGVSSIELEGLMLMGAFAGFVGAFYTQNLWFGLLLAIVSGVLLAAIYGFLVVFLGSKTAIIGMGVVLFATGFTSFFYRALFGVSTQISKITPFPTINIPVLSEIPILGPVLFQQHFLVYLSFALVLFTWFFFKKTALGLNCKAVGENPFAADTVGIPVRKYRFLGVLVTGGIAAIGGACLSMASSSMFIEGISAQKGYAAFAIIILGKYSPIGALLGCLLYGFADALQLNIQALGTNIPFQFLLMLPYLFTIIVLFITGEGKCPEGHNKFFRKGAQN